MNKIMEWKTLELDIALFRGVHPCRLDRLLFSALAMAMLQRWTEQKSFDALANYLAWR